MTADPHRRAFRNRQRRIRRRQAMTGETYTAAAAAVEAEWQQGRHYLDDPSVPADLAAAVRKAGLIPLEALTLRSSWWCRCRWCSEVVEVKPNGHGYQSPGRCPYFLDAGKHEAGRCTRPEPDPILWDGPAPEWGDPFGDDLFRTSWPVFERDLPRNGQAE